MSSLDIYVSNDNVLTLVGLKNIVTNAFINSATVTVTLVDSTGADVSGQVWPTTMSYQAASNGNYIATLEDVLVLSGSETYTAKVSADAGAGLKGYWEIALNAKTRTS